MNIMVFLAVFIGGGLGALLRHVSVSGLYKLTGEVFPYGTLFVNVAGSLIIGLLMELMAVKWQVSLEMRALLITGVLGGFTTFSAFSFDVLKLVDTAHYIYAASYVLASVGLSLAAVFGGVFLVRGLMS